MIYNLNNMKKFLYVVLGFLIAAPLLAWAVNITVPSAPSAGYMLVSTSTGQYISTTTDPIHAGSFFATSTGAASQSIFQSASFGAPGSSGGSLLVNGSTTLQNFTGVLATTSQATTTKFAISGVSSCSGTQALTTNATGGVVCGTITGSGGAFDPFTHTSVFGQTTSASSTLIALTGTPASLAASSTSYFDRIIVGTSTLGGLSTSTFNGNLVVSGNATSSTVTAVTVTAANFIDTSFTGNNCIGESSGIIGQATNCVSSLASAGGSLTISSPTGNVDASLNLGNSNSWTVLQSFKLASTSQLSVFNTAYFGATATSTFNNLGDLFVVGSTTLQNFTARNATTSNATTTSLAIANLTSGNCVQVGTGGNLINSPNGACGSASGLAAYDAFTHPAAGQSATTSVMINQLISGTSTIGTLVATSSITNKSVTSALVLNGSGGLEGAYGGSAPCTNQVALSLSATGVITCTSITDAMLSSTFLKGVDPFTHTSVFGQTTSATSTLLALTGTPASLAASSTSYFDQIKVGTTTSGNLATSTFAGHVTVAGNASSTSLVISNTGTGAAKCLQVDGAGVVSAAAAACGSGSAGAFDPFSPRATTFGVSMSATTSPIWFQGGIFASSTLPFAIASTTFLPNGYVGFGSTTPTSAISVGTGKGVGNTYASSSIRVAEYRYGGTNEGTTTAKTIDCNTANTIHWPIGQSATTLTLTGITPGQPCMIIVENPTTAAGALTWAAASGYTLLWPNNTTPTQTTAANRNDMWYFKASQGSSTMQILGQQISY